VGVLSENGRRNSRQGYFFAAEMHRSSKHQLGFIAAAVGWHAYWKRTSSEAQSANPNPTPAGTGRSKLLNVRRQSKYPTMSQAKKVWVKQTQDASKSWTKPELKAPSPLEFLWC